MLDAKYNGRARVFFAIPAQAGIQFRMRRFAAITSWIPACAGMTAK
jgi:hypothetical protein